MVHILLQGVKNMLIPIIIRKKLWNVVVFLPVVAKSFRPVPAALAFGQTMNLRTFVSIAALLFVIRHAPAQNIFNSPYSVYGVGMMLDRTSSLNRGMAGVGIGIQDEFNLNHANPASYGSITNPISHLYEIGLYVESDRFQTSKMTDSKSSGGLTNISYWFKFKPWWSAVAGLSPYSSVSYNISTQRDLGALTDVDYNYYGSGNISSVYLGNSFQLTKNLSLGVTGSYLFGSIVKNESIDLSTGTLTLENKIATHKFALDYGLQYKIKLAKRSLVIGAVANSGLTLKGKQSGALYDSNADTLDNSSGESVYYKLPASVGMGLGLHSKRSIIAADLKFTNWAKANFSDDQDIIFQDTWKFSAGYVYKGNPNAENYWGLISVRSGFHVQQYQLKLKGNNFPAWGVSMGISLPAFDNKSSINLTYSFDKLGTINNGLISQKSGKIMLDIVIRDLWGIKRKFD